jgi:hypothetical protein
MTKNEMRFIRRELINKGLVYNNAKYLYLLKYIVRRTEISQYGFELKAYA